MGSIQKESQSFFILSTILSAFGLIAALFGHLPKLSLFAATVIIFFNTFLLLLVQKNKSFKIRVTNWIKNSSFSQVGFIISLSIFSSGLGFITWIFLFDPASLVRSVLVQLSPVIGWGVAVAGLLLAALGRTLNEEEKKRNGFLIGATLFSVIGHLFLFWLSAQIFSYTIDDAYITFRYSKNLAEGFGPTYNPTMPPVEGYTPFLWMLLMTLPHFIGLNVATFSKILSILLMCGTFTIISLETFTLTKQFPVKARIFFGVFAGYLLFLLPITSIHTVSGMETALFIFLISIMVLLVTVGITENTKTLLWSPLAGLVLGLTRPEGNMISVLLLAFSLMLCNPEIRKHLTWYSLSLYFIPGAIYFAWRYFYYDLLLPMPFYMKVANKTGTLAGAGEVGSFLLFILPSISVLLLAAILRMRKIYWTLMIPILFLLVFFLFPAHAMGFSWRFIYPSTPFIGILSAIGGIVIYDLLRTQIQSNKPWEILLFIGLFTISLGNLNTIETTIKNLNLYGSGISNYKKMGELLSEFNDQHEFTLAIGDAGTVPYYSDWQVIDLFGLNSREVMFGDVPTSTIVLEQQKADLIFLSGGPNPNRISDEHAGSQRLYTRALDSGMTLLGTFPFDRANHIWVLGYPDTELAQFLQANAEFRETP